MARSGAQEALVQLNGYGGLHVSRHGGELAFDELPDTELGLGRQRKYPPLGGFDSGAVAPIRYQNDQLGEVAWRTGDPAEDVPSLEELARQLALHLQREEVRRRSLASLGEEMQLVGHSAALQSLEDQIERIAATDLPLLVEGEFGVEKLQVACAVHFSGPRRAAPFVEVNCHALAEGSTSDQPDEWCERARGGTLFLNGIDELDSALQRRLPLALQSQAGQWLSAQSACRRWDVRIVASATGLRAKVEEGRFSRAIHAELSLLCIEIPPLRERREDIRPWMEHFFSRCGRDPYRDVSDEVFTACGAYAWPENLFELRRVVARLDAMSGHRRIDLSALAHHAPTIASAFDTLADRDAPPKEDAVDDEDLAFDNSRAAPTRPSTEGAIAQRLACDDFEFVEQLHPGLRQALRHIASNFDEPFSLADLARAACVSPSHLSFLFRTELGTSFKTLLSLVRIERAKRLLTENTELRITDVCLEVGFSDLSHFEKTFRRFVQVNPREFRRRLPSEERALDGR